MKNLLLFLSIISLVSSCSNLPKYTPALDKFVPGEEFRDSLLKSQIFQINPNTDTTVEGAEGTFIFIPEHAFVDANGNTVEGEIKLELAEALEPADMILANLPTLSNGKLLETGGMLYLKASADGKEVFPAKGKEPIVEIPAPWGQDPGMQLYKGVRDSKGNLNWVDPKPLVTFLIPVDLELLDF